MSKKLQGDSEVSEKAKVGRPSKYNENTQKLSDEYVDNYKLYNELVGSDGKITHMVNSIPSVAGLAKYLGVHRDTIYEWSNAHSQFSDTLERLKQTQEVFLIHHGLTKGYDSGFAKFLAINMTSYKDKVEQSIEQRNIEIKIDSDDAEL